MTSTGAKRADRACERQAPQGTSEAPPEAEYDDPNIAVEKALEVCDEVDAEEHAALQANLAQRRRRAEAAQKLRDLREI